ncbi:hypothetical protein J2W52_005523 [Rhizobium miluonense]|uniref:Uncharacterized protein n=1 Tax=Rhizobium miluonense TaxID=411945 RepID=A0ABU1SY29_9HYPH|nr:hypothetical protein [Rhizobium miluonense]
MSNAFVAPRFACMYAAKGINRLMRICDRVSSPKRRDIQSFPVVARGVMALPIVAPMLPIQTNVVDASGGENVPVVAAAIAKRMQTRPEASFRSDSPSRMWIRRFATGKRLTMADTATASAGEMADARANTTGKGIDGII